MPKWCTFTSVFLVHFSLVDNNLVQQRKSIVSWCMEHPHRI
jgi:hypothetical protein